jgi:hypothetical protein
MDGGQRPRAGGTRNGLPTAELPPSWNRSEGPPKTPRRVETMGLPRTRSPRGSTRRRVALWTALATGWILPSVGCQVEYAGMTLPSGRYMHDDVQYFPSGPDFPWANTQAATQRARMRAMGIEPPPPIGTAPIAPGTLDPTQQRFRIQAGGVPGNVNVMPMVPEPGMAIPPQPAPPEAGGVPGGLPTPPPPGAAPPPGAVPARPAQPPAAAPPAAVPPPGPQGL